ncbi:microsomal signal peptidase 25 kDa subunit-domain-containing protein [Xylaria venustula]|nr:microsomal signal peptidase 25 kDa subunit-domain-containing protein [Xylaria venustula]
MTSQERISVHNLADLKNTSDDAIPNYLNSLKFKQDHSLIDTRLALGYSAFAIAAACFLWDYKLGFENTKLYTAVAVALYSLVNGALTIWISFGEKGIVYQGTAPNGTKVSVSTSTKKNEPIYHVTVEVKPKGSGANKIEFARSFTEWFDVQGHFVALPFQTMFATTVPLIAQADPKRAAAATVVPGATASSEFLNMDAATLDAIAAAESTATDSVGKKAKRRKA